MLDIEYVDHLNCETHDPDQIEFIVIYPDWHNDRTFINCESELKKVLSRDGKRCGYMLRKQPFGLITFTSQGATQPSIITTSHFNDTNFTYLVNKTTFDGSVDVAIKVIDAIPIKYTELEYVDTSTLAQIKTTEQLADWLLNN